MIRGVICGGVELLKSPARSPGARGPADGGDMVISGELIALIGGGFSGDKNGQWLDPTWACGPDLVGRALPIMASHLMLSNGPPAHPSLDSPSSPPRPSLA
ncbi:hypothetical protein NL676_020711 [Syzygium grande]|nr:hypothetical protein NL676_020711 [Syzygium grande]